MKISKEIKIIAGLAIGIFAIDYAIRKYSDYNAKKVIALNGGGTTSGNVTTSGNTTTSGCGVHGIIIAPNEDGPNQACIDRIKAEKMQEKNQIEEIRVREQYMKDNHIQQP